MSDVLTPPAERTRFRTIDGLRGIAAVAVALFHFNLSIERSAPHWVPEWFAAIARNGGYGVDIFFVISGFVIAYSVRDGKYTFRYLGLFALRRSIRLDPPYWLTIAAELILIPISLAFFPTLGTPFPSTPKILSHLVYAQGILGYGHILPIFWTLCFEIQFYLMFVGLLVLWEPVKGRVSTRSRELIPYVVLGGLFALSLLVRWSVVHPPIQGLALQRWFEFFLGVLSWWVVSKHLSVWPLIVAYGAVLASIALWHPEAIQALPIVVSSFIVWVGKAKRFDTMLANRPLLFLGKISYSLYLFHGPIGERWISLVERLVGPSFGVGWAYFTFASAFAISIGVSFAIWRLVEVPTMAFSRRIRLESRAVEEDVSISTTALSLVTT